MAFGQQSGSPATARQVQELLVLLHEAGHTDFRDARGPMGFTQRQAAGKFTRDEATAFIEQLEAAGPEGSAPEEVDAEPSNRLLSEEEAIRRMMSPEDQAIRAMSAEHLAAELRRRGWIVIEP
jgi:hypothetical protein